MEIMVWYFLFWDRLMGTMRKDYDSTYEETTAGKVTETEKVLA